MPLGYARYSGTFIVTVTPPTTLSLTHAKGKTPPTPPKPSSHYLQQRQYRKPQPHQPYHPHQYHQQVYRHSLIPHALTRSRLVASVAALRILGVLETTEMAITSPILPLAACLEKEDPPPRIPSAGGDEKASWLAWRCVTSRHWMRLW